MLGGSPMRSHLLRAVGYTNKAGCGSKPIRKFTGQKIHQSKNQSSRKRAKNFSIG